MTIILGPDLEELVEEKVRSGRYTSASEVIRDSLRLLREQDILNESQQQELRKEVTRGLEQAERGEFVEGKEVFANLHTRNSVARTSL